MLPSCAFRPAAPVVVNLLTSDGSQKYLSRRTGRFSAPVLLYRRALWRRILAVPTLFYRKLGLHTSLPSGFRCGKRHLYRHSGDRREMRGMAKSCRSAALRLDQGNIFSRVAVAANAPLLLRWRSGAVSSAVRASGLHPEGPAFKSLTAHHCVWHFAPLRGGT